MQTKPHPGTKARRKRAEPSASLRPVRSSASNGAGDSADDRRERILNAAITEFGRQGLAGARTDAIAARAEVNKALIYYYFHSKVELYAAALDASSAKVLQSALHSLEHEGSAGERSLRSALNHFDRIASQHEYRQLIQQELARLKEGGHEEVPMPLVKIFGVLVQKMERVLDEGMKTGELIRTDKMQILYSVLGANVFYFLSAPMMRLIGNFDPLTKRSIQRRRKSALTFLGASLFTDRQRGAELARRVLADTPMPEIRQTWTLHPTGGQSR